jgi:hypothetical protein
MKNPDCVSDMLDDAAKEAAAAIQGVTEGEREHIRASRREALENRLGKWIEYGEYLRVEFDLDAGTATVLPVGG